MDLWIDPAAENVNHANKALAEFGSVHLLEHQNRREILQLGVAPDRIDLLRHVPGVQFKTAWKNLVRGRYGRIEANRIGLNDLIRIKRRIDHPRHQEDVRVLREVMKLLKHKK